MHNTIIQSTRFNITVIECTTGGGAEPRYIIAHGDVTTSKSRLDQAMQEFAAAFKIEMEKRGIHIGEPEDSNG